MHRSLKLPHLMKFRNGSKMSVKSPLQYFIKIRLPVVELFNVFRQKHRHVDKSVYKSALSYAMHRSPSNSNIMNSCDILCGNIISPQTAAALRCHNTAHNTVNFSQTERTQFHDSLLEVNTRWTSRILLVE